jgi:hypothetical protein
VSQRIEEETEGDLIAHLRSTSVERVKVADLYGRLAGQNPLHPDSGIMIVCRKCGGEYLSDRHELVQGFGYFYHKRCVPDGYVKDVSTEDESDV